PVGGRSLGVSSRPNDVRPPAARPDAVGLTPKRDSTHARRPTMLPLAGPNSLETGVVMIRTFRFLAIAICFVALLSAASAAEFRNWSDASGKFSVKAKYVSLSDGKVTLEQEDGSSLEIELAKLSAADQKYVNDLRAAGDNPFKKTESPFKSKSMGKSKT